MKPYRKQDIEHIYGDLMLSACKNYAKCRHEIALKDIEAAANWAYGFNHIYTDPEAEQLLKLIGEAVIEPITLDVPQTDHCVLIDSYLSDNRGLSQQYLRAMMANGLHILVIFTRAGAEPGKDIIAEINSYKKADIVVFPKGISRIEEASKVSKAIAAFSPAHIFLHLTPWDTVALMACSKIKGANVYNINLTDHAYWLGASFINYNIEFRPYGYTVSMEKRGLKKEQLLSLAYYPIDPVFAEFEGFPPLPEDSVKVFTGGALYKMLGKNDIFFRMMDRILNISSKVYILVAGISNAELFEEKVATLKNKDRIILIGRRHDIDAVFDHCDIYLGTYPMMGGLMSQYAAKHGKPIIAYHDEGDVMNAVEQIVNIHHHYFQSFTNLESMSAYAKKLIEDEEFRKKEGIILQESTQTSEKFDEQFMVMIKERKCFNGWDKVKINYDAFFNRYLELENMNFDATRMLVAKLKIRVFMMVKIHRKNLAYTFIKMTANKVVDKYKHWGESHLNKTYQTSLSGRA